MPSLNITREQILRYWHEDTMTLMDISLRLGCSVTTLSRLASEYRIPRRSAVHQNIVADPTPEEIAERARECRERHYAERRGESVVATGHRRRRVGAR